MLKRILSPSNCDRPVKPASRMKSEGEKLHRSGEKQIERLELEEREYD
jgi:hypothetical protein